VSGFIGPVTWAGLSVRVAPAAWRAAFSLASGQVLLLSPG
jgi:hypothetical protein